MIIKDSFTKNSLPPIYECTSLSFLMNCPGFFQAREGSMLWASIVVNLCTNEQLLTQLRKKYPFAVLLPVIAKNKLPFALAQKIGLKIQKNIFNVKKGTDYIIVDDIAICETALSIFKIVSSGGGNVCAITVLACPARNTAASSALLDFSRAA